MNDRELLGACLDGVEGAWEEFVSRFGRLIWRAVNSSARRVGPGSSAQDLEDAFSAVTVALLEDDRRRLREFRWQCSLATWISVLASRRASNFFRDRARTAGPLRLATEDVLLAVASEGKRQDDLTQRGEEIDRLKAALCGLSERDRLALTAFHADGRSYKEIARLLGVPSSSVGQIIARARSALRRAASGGEG